jgi:exodeoxyribonuclease III
MRVVSWNCCQAFRKKWKYADAFAPNVVIVPEAEEPARLPADLLDRYPYHAWIGDIPFKGLLVLGDREHPLRIADAYNPQHRYVLPVEVLCQRLTLFAVWTQRDKLGTYTEHLSRALEDYAVMLANGKTIIAGDFNANTIWDAEHRRDVTHSQNVAWLEERGIASAYHELSGESQGNELSMTHAFRRDLTNLFHIDYCFMSQPMIDSGCHIHIPDPESWISMSDHGPIVVDIDLGDLP